MGHIAKLATKRGQDGARPGQAQYKTAICCTHNADEGIGMSREQMYRGEQCRWGWQTWQC